MLQSSWWLLNKITRFELVISKFMMDKSVIGVSCFQVDHFVILSLDEILNVIQHIQEGTRFLNCMERREDTELLTALSECLLKRFHDKT